MEKVVILDNIRSAHNVGSIFRTSDGAGVSKIFLCGYTPKPIDRFGRVQPEIGKTSLGATESVAWESVEKIGDLFDRLHGEGYSIASVEQTANSISYKDWQSADKVAFVFGNEVDGVQENVVAWSDVVLEIPMLGKKESLNVSNSAAIILYQYL